MKRRIKKLFYSSVVTFMSIAMNFDTEARVTREVAEATLPYLMEAVGIPQDANPNPTPNNIPYYNQNKLDAIIRMIYTDAGQQQMVDWAVNDIRPPILSDVGAPFNAVWPQISSNVIRNPSAQPNQRERIFQSLFPCNTRTFTSFANHETKLGKYLLTSVHNPQQDICMRLLKYKIIESIKTSDDIIRNLSGPRDNIDCQLAKVVFILDIFDTNNQIWDLINNLFTPRRENQFNATSAISKEYTCRPIPATMAKNMGDCVETLYRHLVNIAIQDPNELDKFHIERLPIQLQKYYDPRLSYNQSQKFDGFKIRGYSESGMTDIQRHETWKKNLSEVISINLDISNGSITNIAKVLDYIAFFNENRNVSLVRADDINGLSTLLQNALNKLAALNNPSQPRFIVNINNNATTLDWANKEIIIQDRHARRTITIGICEKSHHNYGHAEITKITLP